MKYGDYGPQKPYVPPIDLRFQVQSPDLTECLSSYNFDHLDMSDEFIQQTIKTEFIFVTTALTSYSNSAACSRGKRLRELGFRAISSMNNWYPSHSGEERQITLWWKRVHTGKDVVAQRCDKYTPYPYIGANTAAYHQPRITQGGCGFKFGTLPLRQGQYWRYHTLLRLPLTLSRLRLHWLETYNFKQIDTGTFASFWANGWDPKTYDFDKVEWPYWESYGIPRDHRTILLKHSFPPTPIKERLPSTSTIQPPTLGVSAPSTIITPTV